MGILELIENFHNIDFSYLKMKPDITYLNNFKGKKILLMGYEKWETNLPTYEYKPIKNIEKDYLNTFDIIVLGSNINYQRRSYIIEIINLMKSIKKPFIFEGYTCISNMNLENTKNMFRPIDITKHPFNIIENKIIQQYFEYKTLIIYLLALIFGIYFSLKKKDIAFKVYLVLIVAFVLFLPRKKILYINNV